MEMDGFKNWLKLNNLFLIMGTCIIYSAYNLLHNLGDATSSFWLDCASDLSGFWKTATLG